MNWINLPFSLTPFLLLQNERRSAPQAPESRQQHGYQQPVNIMSNRNYGSWQGKNNANYDRRRPTTSRYNPTSAKSRRAAWNNGQSKSPLDHNGNKVDSARSGRYFNDSQRLRDSRSSITSPSTNVTSASTSKPSTAVRNQIGGKRKLDLSEAPDFISLNSGEPAAKHQRFSDSEDEEREKDDNFGSEPFTQREIRRMLESDSFSDQIARFFRENQQKPEFFKKKLQLMSALQNALKYTAMTDAKLYLVGSSVNGFGRITSDADFCLVTSYKSHVRKERKRMMGALHQVRDLLCGAPFAQDLQMVPAKVPIVKFTDAYSGMECDINVNNTIGVRNTELMRQYSKLDPRVRPLALIVKEWAHQMDINDASRGTLNSYSIVLMVVHFLQHGVHPPVLPCLQKRHPELYSTKIPIDEIGVEGDKTPSYRSHNKSTLSELLREFFKYFANFNFASNIMSVRTGKILEVYDAERSTYWRSKEIKIEEPFDLSNTARAVHNAVTAKRIFDKIREAHQTLLRGGHLQSILWNAPPRRRVHSSVIVIDD